MRDYPVFIIRFSILFLASQWAPLLNALDYHHFPVSSAMRNRVSFWKQIFTDVNSTEGLLHDSQALTVVYKKIKLPDGDRRLQGRYIKGVKESIRNKMHEIIRNKAVNLSSEANILYQKMGKPTIFEIRQMVKQIRFQRGMKDRYYEGLIRSQPYIKTMRQIMRKSNIPEDLAYMPHVESSFNINAYSKVGAAGIWQFMRSTARLYMTLDYIIDQRRDPYLATKAAVKLLKHNYEKLGNWPLAITAYNHGTGSISRAIKKLNTTKISEIIERYKGRRFGFASKNFYASFIASSEIAEAPEIYFGGLRRGEPHEFATITLEKRLTIADIVRELKVSKKILKQFNPALRPIVFQRPIYLPRYFKLQLPSMADEELKRLATRLKSGKTRERQEKIINGSHQVQAGESLYSIALLYQLSVNDLIIINEIDDPSFIRPGQQIKLVSSKKSKVASPILIAKNVEKTKEALPAMSEAVEEDEGAEEPSDLQREHDFIASFQKGRRLSLTNVGPELFEVVVEADETIGHFADWLDTDSSSVRQLNNMTLGKVIRVGQKLRLRIPTEKKGVFLKKRNAYLFAIEEDFFQHYRIEETITYRVNSGDTYSGIIEQFALPLWLIRKYQKEPFTKYLQVGQALTIPKVVALK